MLIVPCAVATAAFPLLWRDAWQDAQLLRPAHATVSKSGLASLTLTPLSPPAGPDELHRLELARAEGIVLQGWVLAAPRQGEGVADRRDGAPAVAFEPGPEPGCFRLELPAGGELRFSLASSGSWYGGPSTSRAFWPINTNRIGRQPFLSNDFLSNREGVGSVLEANWVTSTGVSVRLLNDVPMEIMLNEPCDAHEASKMGTACAQGQLVLLPTRGTSSPPLQMQLCSDEHVLAAHERGLRSLPPMVGGPPAVGVMRAPIWSTWARFKMNVSRMDVLAYAREIDAHGYPRSHLEIDDRWSSAYGDLSFDAHKFPAPAEMVAELHALGFNLTLWVIPFAEPRSAAFVEGAKHGYWLRGLDGAPELVPWWQGEGAVLNVSDAKACDWFVGRLRQLMLETGVDGFKFDAGEAQFVPAVAREWALDFAGLWARLAARLGSAGEVRSAHGSQDVPVWLREFDKDSSWSQHNGLRSLITSALQMGVLGYAFVLPDMVGGNAYADGADWSRAHELPAAAPSAAAPVTPAAAATATDRDRGEASFFFGALPSRELFIRWCFANALLPAVQFSIPPWLYDEGATAACSKALGRREARMAQLEALAERASRTYQPIVAPLWAYDPLDPSCHAVDDEFMLGGTTLVAPVLEPAARARSIYLPRGVWRSERGETYTGPTWLHAYPVPLDHLAEFDVVESLGDVVKGPDS